MIDALVGESATPETRTKFRHMLKNGELERREIEIQVQDNGSGGMPMFEVPGMPGAQMGMLNIGEMMGKAFGGQSTKTRKCTVTEAREILQRGRIRQAARSG